MDAGIVSSLVSRLACGDLQVMTPALRALGNVVTGSDCQTDAVLAAGSLPVFNNLLKHPRMNIVKEAAWTVSNITAGNPGQIQAVIDANILPNLIEVLVRVSSKIYFCHPELESSFKMAAFSYYRVISSLRKRLPGPSPI